VKIIVTGSRGFIGRRIMAEAARAYPLASIHECDLKEGYDCRSLFATDQRADLVFHCAATVGGREGIDYNAAFLGANNLQLDGALFEWALRTKPGRVIYFSSAAAYPVAYQGYVHKLAEDDLSMSDIRFPDESYGWAKLTGEVVAHRVRAAGIPITVVRPFSSYDYDQDDCYPFPEFIHRGLRHADPFTVWGDGLQTRDFIHVDDLVGAIFTMVRENIDGPCNLGTGVATSVDDLARLVMGSAGYMARIEHLLDKPMGVKYRVADNTRMRAFYEPKITIEEGVARGLALAR
jgi:nucleoside-diphosphate-sugar epimerase